MPFNPQQSMPLSKRNICSCLRRRHRLIPVVAMVFMNPFGWSSNPSTTSFAQEPPLENRPVPNDNPAEAPKQMIEKPVPKLPPDLLKRLGPNAKSPLIRKAILEIQKRRLEREALFIDQQTQIEDERGTPSSSLLPAMTRNQHRLSGPSQGIDDGQFKDEDLGDEKLKLYASRLGDENYYRRRDAVLRLVKADRRAVTPVIEEMEKGDLEVLSLGCEILLNLALQHAPGNDGGAYQHLADLSEEGLGTAETRSRYAIEEVKMYRRILAEQSLANAGAYIGIGPITIQSQPRNNQRILDLDSKFQMTPTVATWFEWCSGIENVVIHGDSIQQDVLAAVAKLPNMKTLMIHDGAANAETLAPLIKAKQLESLEIRYVRLANDVEELLVKLPVREELSLIGTGLNQASFDRLQLAIKGVQIEAKKGGFLGVTCNTGRSPCKIDRVIDGSGADKAGLKPEDIVVSINGVPIDRFEDLKREISKYDVGETVEVHLLRNNQKVIRQMTLGQQHPQIDPVRQILPFQRPNLPARLQPNGGIPIPIPVPNRK